MRGNSLEIDHLFQFSWRKKENGCFQWGTVGDIRRLKKHYDFGQLTVEESGLMIRTITMRFGVYRKSNAACVSDVHNVFPLTFPEKKGFTVKPNWKHFDCGNKPSTPLFIFSSPLPPDRAPPNIPSQTPETIQTVQSWVTELCSRHTHRVTL